VPLTQKYNTGDEAVFLQQQATDAKTAIQQTLAEMQEHARAAVDVRWWTQQYPWIAVGAAAVLGFVATSVLTRDGRPSPRADTPPPVATAQASFLTSLLAPLFTTLRSALVSAVVSGVMDKVQERELEQEQRIAPDAS
jgi:hypothetical protein